MEVSLFLADQYGARRDLLIAGALLHDIGKLRELSYDTTTDYTVEGNLDRPHRDRRRACCAMRPRTFPKCRRSS